MRNGRVWQIRVMMHCLPFVMIFERAVTGFAADSHFRHGCVNCPWPNRNSFEERYCGIRRIANSNSCPAGPVAIFPRVADVIAINVKPLIRSRVIGGFLHLVAATGKWREELNQRVMADDAIDWVRPAFAVQAARNDLLLTIFDANGGGIGTVLEIPRRIKCCSIHG